MIWFKETYRALSANPRMTLTEQGALWNLCRYAWDRQGITERDLLELSRTLREPLEIFSEIWPDFISIAEEKDGKWMLPEHWQGVEKYTQKRITGEEMIKRRWEKQKKATVTEDKGLTDTEPNTAVYTVPYTDIDIDLDIEPSVSTKNKKKNTTHVESSPKIATAVIDVFSFWKEKLKYPQSVLTPKRKQAIAGRLKEGYTPEQIKRGIIGCANSEWHRGKNERQRPFDDIELICRTGEKLESFIAIADRTAQPTQRIFR